MIGWHHWLNEHEFEKVLGAGDGQRGQVCCSPWGHKELDMTERLNWTEGHTVTTARPCSSHELSSLRLCPRSPLHKCLLSWARCSDILQSHYGATGWCWCHTRVEPKESKMSKGWGHQGCHMELRAALLVPVTQPCLTLGNPTDCSPPGSSIHGILQARILECVQHNLHANDKTMAWI